MYVISGSEGATSKASKNLQLVCPGAASHKGKQAQGKEASAASTKSGAKTKKAEGAGSISSMRLSCVVFFRLNTCVHQHKQIIYSIYIYIHLFIYEYIYIQVNAYVCIYVNMHTCIHICIMYFVLCIMWNICSCVVPQLCRYILAGEMKSSLKNRVYSSAYRSAFNLAKSNDYDEDLEGV